MKLYEKYDLETKAYLYEASFFEEGQQPIGYTSVSKGSLIKAFLDEENGVAYEGANLEEIQVMAWENDLENETQKYIQRTKDGIDAYAKISAEFRLAKLNNIITEEGHRVIEEILIPVRNEVLAGQWISGLQILQTIGSGSIGGVLYNRLVTQITNYINENY